MRPFSVVRLLSLVAVLNCISIISEPAFAVDFDQYRYDVYIGDRNGDGFDDIYLSARNSIIPIHGEVLIPISAQIADNYLLLSMSDGSYSDPVIVEDINTDNFKISTSATLFDFNNDGIMDLLIGQQGTSLGNIALLGRADTDFIPTLVSNIDDPALFNTLVVDDLELLDLSILNLIKSVKFGDFNDDGLQDLAIFRSSSNNVVFCKSGSVCPDYSTALYIQQSNGEFEIRYNINAQESNIINLWKELNQGYIFGDFDGNGYVDIRFMGLSESIGSGRDFISFTNIIESSSDLVYTNSSDFELFFMELNQWLLDRDYYDNNAPLVTQTVVDYKVLLIYSFYVPYECYFYRCTYDSLLGRWKVWIPFEREINIPDYSQFLSFTTAERVVDINAEPRSGTDRRGNILAALFELGRVLGRVLNEEFFDTSELPTFENSGISSEAILTVLVILIENSCSQPMSNSLTSVDAEENCIAIAEEVIDLIVTEDDMDPDLFDLERLARYSVVLNEAITARRNQQNRIQCSYVKALTTQRYYGRTSGLANESCEIAIRRRDLRHTDLTNEGFGPAELDQEGLGPQGYLQIRGREQQLIDAHLSESPTDSALDAPNVRNKIRGVARANPAGCLYWTEATLAFGPIALYTGFTQFPTCLAIPDQFLP